MKTKTNRLIGMLFLTLVSLLSKGQAYYDALELRKLVVDIDSSWLTFPVPVQDEAARILQKYTTGTVYADVEQAFANNVFIRLPPEAQQSVSPLSGAAKLFSNIGGLPVTDYADALAQFMVERAKEELNVAFFERFRNYLHKHPELHTLFPETSDFLSTMLAHEYSQLINGLRDSFHDDLRTLIYNLDDLFLLPKYQRVVNDFPEILVVIRSIQLISEIDDTKHPADIINDFKTMREWDSVKRKEVQNLHNLIKVSGLFSEALRFQDGSKVLFVNNGDTLIQQQFALNLKNESGATTLKTWSGTRSWISARHFEYLFKDDLAFRIFLGLVYQESLNDSIQFRASGTIRFTEIMEKNKENLFLFRTYFLDFVRLAEKVDERINMIKAARDAGEEIQPQQYIEYINTSIDVIEYGLRVSNLINEKIEGAVYIEIARTANDLYRNIHEKDYASAVTDALKIVEKVTGLIPPFKTSTAYTEELKKIEANPALNPQQKDASKKDLMESFRSDYQSFATLNKVSKGVLKYGVFMANAIEADGPAEIKQAISNAALPVGSSSYKKYQQLTLSINSYLGAQLRLNKEKDVKRTWDQTLGITAPVGLSLNHGLPNGAGSISLFAPLLDIGAIAQFRLSNDSSELTEEIRFGNIFSPGGYLVYGFAENIPLALGLGGQYGPGLFKIEGNQNGSTGNTYINPSWRWNIFLCVDIPLFHLTRGKKLGAK